jgi:sigma-B regulation protein RsbU (phosphoserine phosphatase)
MCGSPKLCYSPSNRHRGKDACANIRANTYTRSVTGGELAGILIGAMLLVLGCASVLASLLRPRRGPHILLAFGLTAGLYGARLLAEQAPVRATIGDTWVPWSYAIAFVTYLITVPISYFVEGIIGPGWRHSVRWVSRAVIAFAVAAILIELALARPGAAGAPNSWLVLILIAIALGNVLYASTIGRAGTVLTDRIVVLGAAVFALYIINENLGEVILPGTDIESIGMLFFVVCLGYAVVRSVFRAETEFAGVRRELETARRIQMSLLPRQLPEHAELDIAVRFVPMTAVAGDIYDFVQIGPSCLGILVADVSGHGIPAALVASMVKVAFSAQVAHAHDPARVLASMNQILCRHLEHAYVTAVYAVVDTDRQTVTLANAGHPPALLRRCDETSRVEHDHGVMLGVFPDAEYTSTEVPLFAPGDRLLLYSDGVLEARDRAGEFFDDARVARWVSGIEQTSAEQFAVTALRELTQWTGGRFDDDVTFVIAERNGGRR